MPSTDLFPDLLESFTNTALSNGAAFRALEKNLGGKNDKPYLKCLVRDKDVMAKPEEIPTLKREKEAKP